MAWIEAVNHGGGEAVGYYNLNEGTGIIEDVRLVTTRAGVFGYQINDGSASAYRIVQDQVRDRTIRNVNVAADSITLLETWWRPA